jgi:hypothetical protein
MELPTMSSNRVSAFPIHAKTSFKADFEKILDFLIRDAAYKTEVTASEMETKLTYVETVNAFIVVVCHTLPLGHCFTTEDRHTRLLSSPGSRLK